MKEKNIAINLLKSFMFLICAVFSAWILVYLITVLYYGIREIKQSVFLVDMPASIANLFPGDQNKINVELTLAIIGTLLLLPFMIKSILQFFEQIQFLFTDVVVTKSGKKKYSPGISRDDLLPQSLIDEKRKAQSKTKTKEDQKEVNEKIAKIAQAKLDDRRHQEESLFKLREQKQQKQQDEVLRQKEKEAEKLSKRMDIEQDEIHEKVADEAVAESYIKYDKEDKKPAIKQEPQPKIDSDRSISEEMPKPKPVRKPANKEDAFLQDLSILSLLGISKAKAKKSPDKINRKMDIG